MFSILVPAFEEERTIGEVVRAVSGIADSEVIVVDDGSRDGTAEVARSAGARVVRLEVNRGKGAALDAGVRAATGDLLVFLDADVRGMDEERVLSLVRPVRAGAVMCVGVRHLLLHRVNQRHAWIPIVTKLSGQRCLLRGVWTAARERCTGYGVESALNYFASRMGEVAYVPLPGLSHTVKERKRGVFPGVRQRLRMVFDILATTVLVRAAPRRRAPRELSRDSLAASAGDPGEARLRGLADARSPLWEDRGVDDLEILPGLAIPEAELAFRTSRSSGPGGQNVNKVETRVTLLFDLAASPSLDEEQRFRLRERLSGRINRQGVLRVSSQRHRSQAANRQAAVARFVQLLQEALSEEPSRKPTRPSRRAKRRRLREKRRRGELKRLRSTPRPEE